MSTLFTQVQEQSKTSITQAEQKAKDDLARIRAEADKNAFFEVLRSKTSDPTYTVGTLLEDTSRTTKLRGYLKEMTLAQLVEVLSPKPATKPVISPPVFQRQKLLNIFLSDPSRGFEVKYLITQMGLDRTTVTNRLVDLRKQGDVVLENGLYRLNTAPAREFILDFIKKNGTSYPTEILRFAQDHNVLYIEETLNHLVSVGTLIQYQSKEVNINKPKVKGK